MRISDWSSDVCSSDLSSSGDESDPLYDEAVRIVTETRRASISGVQRRLKIGYNRAARLAEAMEAAGVVSPPEHNGDRAVLAPPPPEYHDAAVGAHPGATPLPVERPSPPNAPQDSQQGP